MSNEEADPPPKNSEKDTGRTFSQWLFEPQTMIGLSAVLLSLCGLFISLYEASLIRQEQRASVWPRLLIGPSVSDSSVTIRVENSGIGPARVQAAAVEHDGKRIAGWEELLHSVNQEVSGSSTSLINNRVLSPGSEETILSIVEDNSKGEPNSIPVLARQILDGRVDIALCYCSVYDECWITTMQDVVSVIRDGDEQALQENETPQEVHENVASCEGVEISGI